MRLIRLAKLLAVLVATSTATSPVIGKPAFVAPPRNVSPIQAVTQATAVVVGKVTGIERDNVEVSPYEGAPKEQPKQPYKIAKVKISESLLGAKGLTEIKIGFPANAIKAEGVDQPAIDPDVIVRPRPGLGYSAAVLTEGQEGAFILARHFEGDFYVFAGSYTAAPLDKKNADYDKQLAEVKRIVTTVKDPVTALKSKEKEDRLAALDVVTAKYRMWMKRTPAAEETIPEEEAKLILDAMLELPWMPKPGAANPYDPKTLSNYFGIWLRDEQVRLKFSYPEIKMGENQDTTNKKYEEAVRKFITENRDKLTLKRLVEKK